MKNRSLSIFPKSWRQAFRTDSFPGQSSQDPRRQNSPIECNPIRVSEFDLVRTISVKIKIIQDLRYSNDFRVRAVQYARPKI